MRLLAQALMETEVCEQIGGERGERAPETRTAQRNGYRPREWETRAGTVELAIPKLRTGSYFPSILEPRRRAEKALVGVVAQCYVAGVSTRRVEDIAAQMGVASMSKSQVSRLCADWTSWSRRGATGLWTPGRTPLRKHPERAVLERKLRDIQ